MLQPTIDILTRKQMHGRPQGRTMTVQAPTSTPLRSSWISAISGRLLPHPSLSSLAAPLQLPAFSAALVSQGQHNLRQRLAARQAAARPPPHQAAQRPMLLCSLLTPAATASSAASTPPHLTSEARSTTWEALASVLLLVTVSLTALTSFTMAYVT